MKRTLKKLSCHGNDNIVDLKNYYFLKLSVEEFSDLV
jgi:hypothetical protein